MALLTGSCGAAAPGWQRSRRARVAHHVALVECQLGSHFTGALQEVHCMAGQRHQAALHALQGEGTVDEWDAWGDQREIQRRKAERQKAGLTPLQRRQLVRLVSCCPRSQAGRSGPASC